ncbi:phage major capsid protein [Bradyrhizobium japonicum]|uniref:phage major capsid protein n=1 Tax=Bradyrhizobium japonicum TaxID=375 RepID=UPI001E3EF668|nr:phage major capsid protein [Bradyrhizobium japonicum]MCD9110094.1 phage major capsid protein [Bradyrhizobium japonicum]MCD9817074.1 phage major capsid protein [Bradyrhizobium japonicum]MCD9891716.1 phage major capsid protein [Bradyrhizobium japonicum]MCS3982683.1 hypothetical protein [Bradyrhizobium japonicum]MEB2670736.1 phage major capsid protein [Bradyrhizobium japonicum]
MNTHTPIPLRPDPAALREAALRSLAHAAIDTARSVHDRFAKTGWPDDHVAKLITRSAVTQTTLADTQALQQVGLQFVSALVPVSAAAAVIASSLKLSFDGNARIGVPSLTLPHAIWLGEGQSIPAMQGLTTPGTLVDPYKAAMIVTLTGEMIRGSNAEAMVRQALIENAGPTLDAAMFSVDAAGPGVRPAGILRGIPPLPPSSAAAPFDAMVVDIGNIAASLAPASGASQPILIAAPRQAVSLAMSAPRDMWPMLMANLPDKMVIGVVPAALATVIEPPRIEASSGPMLQMDDQPSADPMSGPTISLFQSDEVGLRFILPASWSLRSPSGVAWIEATNW